MDLARYLEGVGLRSWDPPNCGHAEPIWMIFCFSEG